MRLTEHFTREELEVSEAALRLGLDNRCPPELLPNLQRTAAGLERIRAALGGAPIYVSSGYRSREVNRNIGGAWNSRHTLALAADFVAPSHGSALDVAQHLARFGAGLEYDQLIFEGRWVHVGFAAAGELNRRELLTAHFANGVATYTKGIG